MASQSDTGIPAPVLSDGEDMRLLADQAIAVDPSSLESSHDRKVLKAYTVFEDPRITVIPNFLSDSEMQHLLDLAAAYWVPSTVGSGVYKTNDESKDLQNKQSKTRTSYSCMLRSGQTETVQMIEQKLARLAGLEVKYLERLNMVRYAPGQLFNRHHDGRFRPKTVFIYLNDLPENDGGETFFPDLGLKFVPRKGAAVMWSNVISPGVEDNRTIHLGMPPRTSTKYGVNCFFNEKPLREWEAANSAKRGLSVALRRVDPAVLLQEDKTILRPGQLRAFALCEDPRVRVIPRIITDEEVQALLALTHPPADSEAIDPEIYASIEHCIAAAAGRPVEKMEPLKVGKCTPDMTPDGVDLSDQEYLKRFGTVAVFLFLNEMEAADLCFPRLGLEIASCTACAVVWSTTSPSFPGVLRHKAQPPRSGTRIAAMGVFRDVQVVRAVKDVEKKRKLISPQRRIERLFVEEFKKSFFSPNPWYESPELTFPGGNPQKIYNYWMTTRPTRDIERVCDGKDSCGCTWTQLDGRRGASFVSFNQEGQVVFVREVCEPQGLGAKFKDNTLKSLQQVTGVMNAIQGMFSALDRILVQEDPEDGPKPVNGLEAPRSGRAKDVVRYLWEEAQWDPVDPVEKIMSQFSEDAVYEDLTREDSSFVGWEAIKRYQEETKENTPDNMRFVLDEMTDGEKACTVIWHVEFNTRLSPRGVTYYELNDEGKVCYVRAAYDISF